MTTDFASELMESRGETDDFLGDPAGLAEVMRRLGRASSRGSVESAGASRSEAPAWVGLRVNEFEVLELLGVGGMGCVYKARDTVLGRTVALKILPPRHATDEGRRTLLLREAQSAAILRHPGIAAVHSIGEIEGNRFIVMEYVPGPTLRALIRQRCLTPNEVLRYGVQLSQALGHAHRAGIVHRDFKPDNVVVDMSGGEGRDGGGSAKILDFGLAKLLEPLAGEGQGALAIVKSPPGDGVLTLGHGAGTPGYMSPEQTARLPVDARTDVYAFGIVLREMVTTGMPETHGGALARRLKPILERCLEEAPSERYADAREIAGAMERVRLGPERPKTEPRMGKRGLGRVALALTATIPVALVGATALRGRAEFVSNSVSMVPAPVGPTASSGAPSLQPPPVMTAMPALVPEAMQGAVAAAASTASAAPKRNVTNVAPRRATVNKEAEDEPHEEPYLY